MSFELVYYSQQDPKWKADLLGFGDPGDTLGYVGCALTATAMLLSGHGYSETPKTLNKKLKDVGGFVGAAIAWGAVSKIYPNVTLKGFIPCSTTDAPLAQIDASINAGQPVIVQVDSSPASGIQTHWVVLYARSGEDYFMLDPWPYPSVTKPDLLMKRYAQGRTLKRAISHVILYEAFGSGGPIVIPGSDSDTTSGPSARVKADVTWGLNIRSSIDTSSTGNIVTTASAGTQLLLLEADGPSKVGAVNQWVRVRTPNGMEGYAAAWYLEQIPGTNPNPSTEPDTGSTNETPIPSVPTQPMDPKKKYLMVSAAAGANGTILRKTASVSGIAQMTLLPGMLLIVIEPYAKARGKLGKQNQWIYVRGPNKKLGYVLSQFVKLP